MFVLQERQFEAHSQMFLQSGHRDILDKEASVRGLTYPLAQNVQLQENVDENL